MNQNQYDAAEAVELGKAEDVVLGGKTTIPAPDNPDLEPVDRFSE